MPFVIIMTGVGVISLAGIVVNNAIVLIDYIDVLRKRDGLDQRAALIQGGKTRLRPVLLTALTTALGLVPLAVGHRGHDAFELQPLRGKAVAETLQAGVRQHALDLRPQHSGVAQPALGGQVEQGLVRDTAPEEERQARRQLEIVKFPGRLACASPIVALQEARRRQSGRDRRLHALGIGLS